jgi:hypothetical protein
MRINKPNLTQEERVLQVLRDAKDWVNGQYFLRTMMISQYHRAIHNLEKRGNVIEHSEFKDEHGFLSYRLIKEAQQEEQKVDSPIMQEFKQWDRPEKQIIKDTLF